MAQSLTPAEMTILGLVAEQPRHGYEIEKTIDDRGMREWTEIGFSSIYYVMARLQKAGLITEVRETAATRGPARRTYTLTPQGAEVARARTREMLAERSPSFPTVLIGLANLPLIGSDAAIEALRGRSSSLTAKSDALAVHLRAQQPLPAYVTSIFTYSLTMLRAEHAWVHDTLRLLEEESHDQSRLQEGPEGSLPADR